MYLIATATLVMIGLWQGRQFLSQLRVQNMWSLTHANREIIGLTMAHPALLGSFSPTTATTTEDQIRSRIAQLWINQMAAVWYSYSHGHIESSQWDAFRLDIGWSFQDAIIKDRWDCFKQVYAADFQRFVNEAIEYAKSVGSMPPT